MPKEQKSKATLHLPADLWKETKIEAIKRDVDAQDIVAEGLRQYMGSLEKLSRKGTLGAALAAGFPVPHGTEKGKPATARARKKGGAK